MRKDKEKKNNFLSVLYYNWGLVPKRLQAKTRNSFLEFDKLSINKTHLIYKQVACVPLIGINYGKTFCKYMAYIRGKIWFEFMCLIEIYIKIVSQFNNHRNEQYGEELFQLFIQKYNKKEKRNQQLE